MDKVNEYSLYAAIFTLPIHSKIAIYCLMLFAVTSFANGSFSVFKQKLKDQKYLLLLPLIYVLYVIYFFISIDKGAARFDLELKISLLIFPFLFLFSKLNLSALKDRALLVYLSACALSLLIFITLGSIKSIETQNTFFLFYKQLSPLMHISYYALHLTTALAISLRYALLSDKKRSAKYFYFLVSFLLGAGIVLSTSKTALICAFLLLLIATFRYIYISKKWLRASAALLVLLVLLYSAYLYLPDFKYRIDTFISSLNNQPVYHDSTNSREMVWDCAIQLIADQPVSGYGNDANQKLLDCYSSHGMDYEVEQKLNAHNEFFQLYLETGIVGILSLTLLIAIGFSKAIKAKDFLFIAFIIGICINFATESMLETEVGVMYFCFFFCFFDSVNLKNKTV